MGKKWWVWKLQIFFHQAQFPLWAAPLAALSAVPNRELERHKGMEFGKFWELFLLLFPRGNGDLAQIQSPDSAQPLQGEEMQDFIFFFFLCSSSILHCSRGALLPPTLPANKKLCSFYLHWGNSSSLIYLSKHLPGTAKNTGKIIQRSSKKTQNKFLPTAKPPDKTKASANCSSWKGRRKLNIGWKLNPPVLNPFFGNI